MHTGLLEDGNNVAAWPHAVIDTHVALGFQLESVGKQLICKQIARMMTQNSCEDQQNYIYGYRFLQDIVLSA